MSRLLLGSERPLEQWGPVRLWLEDKLQTGQTTSFSTIKEMFSKAKFHPCDPLIDDDIVNSSKNAVRKQLQL